MHHLLALDICPIDCFYQLVDTVCMNTPTDFPTAAQTLILNILDWTKLETTGDDDSGIYITHLELGTTFLLTMDGHLMAD
jgi:hypothetical protein